MKILYILIALVVLMILITVHEFGHYLAGKIFKFKINEFSIGFGKAIYKKTKKNGEIFSVRILPIGGYCAFEGEDEENPGKDAFNSRPAWQRLIVLFSGVLFNFAFGIITSAVYLMNVGYAVPVIAGVRTEISSQYNITAGDQILAVNGENIEAYRSITDLLSKYSTNNNLTLTVSHQNGKTEIIAVEKYNFEDGYFYVADASSVIGNLYVLVDSQNPEQGYREATIEEFREVVMNAVVSMDEGSATIDENTIKFYKKTGETDFVQYQYASLISSGVIVYAQPNTSLGIVYYQTAASYGFFESLGKAWPYAFYICRVIFQSLGGIFTGATQIKDLGGTITTISVMADTMQTNSQAILQIILFLFPMLSINLAIFNILPIPALDGARMCFVLWEMITKKPVSRKVEGWIHTIGLFVLLGLVIVLDILHFIL